MNRVKLFARLASLLAVVALVVSGALVAVKTTVSADDSSSRGDTSWRLTNAVTAPNGASRKPVLFQLLANNDKVDTYNDEIRLDAVIRVAHGEVNPNVGSNTESSATGLRIVYDYVNARSNNSGDAAHDFSTNNNPFRYLNTIDGASGADNWAHNQDQYYTIHKIVHSGLYDYVTISLEADIDYINQDQQASWWNHTAEGRVMPTPPIYVMVGAYTNRSTYPMSNLSDLNNNPLATDLMAGRQTTVFPGMCNDISKESCDIPLSFIGWDANPTLWSNRQANWGLVTDYGLNGQPSGVAPANSFFVRMYNGKYSQDTRNPCYQATSFKYQWIALKNNSNWVPVDALTPTVQQVDNQPATGIGAPPGNVNAAAFNRSKSQSGDNTLYAPGDAQNTDGSIDFAKAKSEQGLDGYFKLVTWPVMNPSCSMINTTDPYRNPANPGITDTMTQSEVKEQLKNAWTIDTAFYKYDVVRPKVPTITSVSNTNTDSSDPANNIGFSAMSSSDPDGQTDDGDFKSNSRSSATKPIIKGAGGTAGQKISVYEDVPKAGATATFSDGTSKKVIVKGVTDDYENMGHLVGTADVNADGTWQLQASSADDIVDLTNPKERERRYHAYQTDPTEGENGIAMNLTSFFSPVYVVNFKAAADKAPTVDPDKIVVPHTQQSGSLDGELTNGNSTTVSIGGTMSSSEGESTMKLYAKHVTSPSGTSGTKSKSASSSVATRDDESALGNEIVGIDSAKCEQSIGVGNDQNWSCSVPVQWFIDNTPSPVADSGCYFKFVAVTANKDGVTAESDPVTKTVDFYAPVVSITSADNNYVKGKVAVDPSTPVILSTILPGATVHLTWPEGTPSSAPTTATVDSDGNWQAKVVYGSKPGDIKAYVVDKETNASKNVVYKGFNPTPPTDKLPFTGGFSSWALLLTLLAVVIAVTTYVVFRKTHSRLTHKGVHAK
ncbi:hypothetical protein [Bifidobacterium sp. ESL0732]|uniref:hypothetical protein n=1 Tax=Bifidobacterium sp. ESL0732 TaxID=2983222 RepID=UPI0023F83F3E|nr:hypothetical protein [Bifidobacterium sp. ESL0732]WEV63956.1 hypothetical protein OZX70_08560 [Bifidobacterium sp. ESL0732]